ncbi:hypothetical protein HMPREF0083_05848 [Aneurinibacillus aneurinilyticus ATCC 12856]|uniref:Uncharacterized protein n=1 Tax=Aneurinibacillus aneurinilyticus ATCC 12856 TaxID=649747 RepID=U1W955_ANEAE|nr:hypothetical protein HMPREF0083_05848 [Aneurinibacillus aneurinilyticus ATCC 12856]
MGASTLFFFLNLLLPTILFPYRSKMAYNKRRYKSFYIYVI